MLSVQMETAEKELFLQKENASIPSYKIRFQRNFAQTGGSNSKLSFVTARDCINVRLTNDTALSALRFEIEFKGKFVYRPLAFSPRTQSLKSYVNFQETSLTVVILDGEGNGIPSGDGDIVNIPIEGDQEFQVTGAYVSTRTTGIKEIDYTVATQNAHDYIFLEQNDPNPFSNRTIIEFQIADDSDVKVIIYDVGGTLIRTILDSRLESGKHCVEWDGRDDNGNLIESGIYLYKLDAGIYSVTKKMVYLR